MTPAPPRPADPDADVRRQLAGAVGADGLEAAWAAYADARIAGLCHEGAWEAALGTAPLPGAPDAGRVPPSNPSP